MENVLIILKVSHSFGKLLPEEKTFKLVIFTFNLTVRRISKLDVYMIVTKFLAFPFPVIFETSA